jgi:20S proteasome alpha/beta subunit
MTLVAAFRCLNNGILLCADREESDGGGKREVDKIYKILLRYGYIFIAGAGARTIIMRACEAIHQRLKIAEASGVSVSSEHQKLIEETLRPIHEEFVTDDIRLDLLIVVAPHAPNCVPILYRSDSYLLHPEPFYAAQGNGKPISDYLADRLYTHGLKKDMLAFLAAFICREASRARFGVGPDIDMIFIYEGEKSLHILAPDAVKEIEVNVPSLSDAIYAYWKEHAKVPEWLTK